MFLRVRSRVTYVNVVMTLALVFAMTGGAFAAKHYLITSTKQINPKVLKALQGKAGPVGPAGEKGVSGANGKDGTNGANGTNGKDGVSVAGNEFAGTKGSCKEGGSEFTAAGSTTYACNGKNGATGFTKTLPKGETETGTWAIVAHLPGTGLIEGSASTAISFNIPLAAAAKLIYVKEKEATPAGCSGNVKEPGAAEGNLCVFAAEEENSFAPRICPASTPLLECLFGAEEGADPSGADIAILDKAAGFLAVNGTWAVTAE